MKEQLVRVTKKFSFDMAHALYGYDGPCKNIHGHTYHLSVTLKGLLISDSNDPKLGMVIDFGDLKQVVNDRILGKYDHALVINDKAPYANAGLIFEEFEKVILVPFQPTCEQLLLHFVDEIQQVYADKIKLVGMRLEETLNSYAEWFAADNQDLNF